MPGHSASEDARKRAYVPGIHRKKRFIEEDGRIIHHSTSGGT